MINSLRKLTLGVGIAALLAALPAITPPVVAQTMPGGALYQTGSQNGQPPLFVPGDAIVAGPVIPATTFNGTIAVSTVGSFTTGVLTLIPGANQTITTPVLLVGSVISGSGVTTGTTITGRFAGTNNYSVITPGGTITAVAASTAMTATPSFTSNWQDTLQKTAPTYASGGCTTTAAFTANADGTATTPFRWTLKQGASGCSSNSTITLTFPAAATTWMCGPITDLTTPARVIISTGAASTTAVVLTDYSAAGAAETMLANDVYAGACAPH